MPCFCLCSCCFHRPLGHPRNEGFELGRQEVVNKPKVQRVLGIVPDLKKKRVGVSPKLTYQLAQKHSKTIWLYRCLHDVCMCVLHDMGLHVGVVL